MDFKIKNNIGIIFAIFLVILLFQSKSFHFLIHTILGRLILVIFILGISSISCILGIIAVLVIIIMINQDNSFYLEGFTQDKKRQMDTALSTSISASTIDTFTGREGFNQIERESMMQKGKRSSEIPVDKRVQSAEDVEPSESKTFSNMSSNI